MECTSIDNRLIVVSAYLDGERGAEHAETVLPKRCAQEHEADAEAKEPGLCRGRDCGNLKPREDEGEELGSQRDDGKGGQRVLLDRRTIVKSFLRVANDAGLGHVEGEDV